MERFLSLPSLPVIKRQTCPATLWNTNMNYIYRQTRNHPLTNSKILIPILKFFDNARIFVSNMSSIGCFLSSLLLWRLSISEFFHAKMHFLEYLNQPLPRAVLIDGSFRWSIKSSTTSLPVTTEMVKEQSSWIFIRSRRY